VNYSQASHIVNYSQARHIVNYSQASQARHIVNYTYKLNAYMSKSMAINEGGGEEANNYNYSISYIENLNFKVCFEKQIDLLSLQRGMQCLAAATSRRQINVYRAKHKTLHWHTCHSKS